MNSADIRSIFELPQTGTHHSQQPKRFVKEKKPDGISRELYSLIGENTPPLTLTTPVFKARPTFKKSKVSPWRWQEFENPSRTDGLRLSHWTKSHPGPDAEANRFAQFNTHVSIADYNDEEYEAYLREDSWTKQETDALFQLCREYDLRFVVIADRFQSTIRQRSMEELKDRFFDVNRRLIKARPPPDGSISKQEEMLAQMIFDKNREVERKKFIESLFTRTPEQIAEEEALFIEARRIEQNNRLFEKERESLKQYLSAPVAPAGATTTSSIFNLGSSSSASDPKSKKKKIKTEAGAEASPTSVDSKKKSQAQQNDAALGISTHDRLTPGVFARSSKITFSGKPAQQQKIALALAELGLSTQLIMPTVKCCSKFEQLQILVATLLELKRQTDKVEHDIKVAKMRKEPGNSDVASTAGMSGDDAGDGVKRSNSVTSSVGDKSNKRVKKT